MWLFVIYHVITLDLNHRFILIANPPPPTNIKQNRPRLNHLNDVELNRRDGKRRTRSGEKSSVIESNIENDYVPAKLSQVFFHTYLPN